MLYKINSSFAWKAKVDDNNLNHVYSVKKNWLEKTV